MYNIRRLAERIRRHEVVFFLGAGASFDYPSDLPTSVSLVRELALRIAGGLCDGSKEPIADNISRGVRFELMLQALTKAMGRRALGVLDILATGQPNANHELIARLADEILAPLVLTTNFDDLLEQALRNRSVAFELCYMNSHFTGDLSERGLFKVMKLHGSLRDRTGRRTHRSVLAAANQVGRSLPRAKVRALRAILTTYDLVFLGYSGLDDFDLLPLLLATESKKEVLWIDHTECTRIERLYAADLRTVSGRTLTNPERVVASRPDGVLLRCDAQSFVTQLTRELFGRATPRARRAPKYYDFRYLDDWERRTELKQCKPFIIGLLLRMLEDYDGACQFFDQVPSTSSLWADASYETAVCLRRRNKVEPARELLRRLSSTSATNSIEGKARALVQLGLLESEQGELRTSRRHLKRALGLRPIDPTISVDAHNNIGMTFLFESERCEDSGGDPRRVAALAAKAELHLSIARRHVGKAGDPQTLANIAGNLGLAFTLLRRYTAAKPEFLEALRLFRSLRLQSEEASCLGNIGAALTREAVALGPCGPEYKRVLREALRFNKDALALKKRVSTPRRLAFTKHEIGEIYRLLGRRDRALYWLRASMVILDTEGLVEYSKLIAKTIAEMRH